jgi:hypothetical protein
LYKGLFWKCWQGEFPVADDLVFTLGDLSIVFVVPSKTTGPMDGLLPSLGGFFNCVLHTLLSEYKVFK